jgi:2-polyprenyl-3-methyl-5-hydroxy-6-metoxy-1,4-benzoquinol methylase
MKLNADNKKQIDRLLSLYKDFKIKSLSIDIDVSDISALMLTDLWPEAVDNNLIVKTDEEKFYRASSIINVMIHDSLKTKKFLDFGCGEGHCAIAAAREDAVVVGYDRVAHDWMVLGEIPNDCSFTTDVEFVEENGPYDIILMYDVVDHIVEVDECKKALNLMKSVMHEHGTAYVRCHPLTSRHATHIYETLNKAYAHLFIDNDKLIKMGHDPKPVANIIRPLATYEALFKEAGFKIENIDVVKEPVEDFFFDVDMSEIIRKRLSNSIFDATKEWQQYVLPIQFIDYQLRKL